MTKHVCLVADLPTPLMANWLWYQWLDTDDDDAARDYLERLHVVISDPRCQPQCKVGGGAA